MPRAFWSLVGIGIIVGALFGVSFAGYGLGYLAESLGQEHLGFAGMGRLANMLILMLVFVMVIATFLTLAERKWSAMMQDRVGPNRARFGGLNTPLAGIPHIITDVLKMLTKEDFRPAVANKGLFNLAPMLAFAPVFALFAVVPAGPTVFKNNVQVDMVVATPDFGILYLFAIASLAVYGTALAGWASNNKFALLGGVRAASQMVSYEVALGLSVVGLMIAFSSVQMPALALGQQAYLWRLEGNFDLGIQAWGILLQPLGFLVFFAASFAEAKRAPFDAPEGESEIIGYFVEYSGMKFGMFMISEFVEVVVLAGVLVVLFFGGWAAPVGNEWLHAQLAASPLLLGAIFSTIFWVKVLALIWVQLLIRWTFPRFRYDQIQTLGWKILLPAGLVNLFVTGAVILWDPSLRWLAVLGGVMIATLIALTVRSSPAEHAEDHGHSDHGHGPASLHDSHGHPLPAATHVHAHGTAGAVDAAPAPLPH
ncbi:MAG: NADH-quinone oxidoreductase subunit H [Myxococcota bacterium]|nr:NADH-quinone oxidoreductase subunit H [Myxococcota bacterium]